MTTSSKVFLELPHGGKLIPDEVAPYIHSKFSNEALHKDADEFSDEIFYQLPVPHHCLRADFWRAFLDMNRSPENRGPDGVVKSKTSQGVQIYKSSEGLPQKIGDLIIEKYLTPYRKAFLEMLAKPEIDQVIFCHTMPGMGTPNSIAHDPGAYRPIFSLINEGDEHGENPSCHTFASGKRIQGVGHIIEKHAANLDQNFQFSQVLTYNFPYKHFSKPRRFDLKYFKGKNPFSIEVNRDLLDHNLSNVAVVRAMMVEIVQFLSAYSE